MYTLTDGDRAEIKEINDHLKPMLERLDELDELQKQEDRETVELIRKLEEKHSKAWEMLRERNKIHIAARKGTKRIAQIRSGLGPSEDTKELAKLLEGVQAEIMGEHMQDQIRAETVNKLSKIVAETKSLTEERIRGHEKMYKDHEDFKKAYDPNPRF